MSIELKITPMEADFRPQPHLPDNSIFEILGEQGIRNMISDHYDLLVKSEVKDLFPFEKEELNLAKQRAADFIIQRFGGPDYYNQRRGKPLLVKRHAPFRITPKARIVWLECYREVLLKQNLPDDVLKSYWQFLDEFSNWMVNTNPNNVGFQNLKVSK